MEIVKEAFIEGRETDTSWEESNSKKNSIKAEVALENFSVMKKREFRSAMPLERICPDSGKVLGVYPSRLAAARWIVDNVLQNPDKNPIAITGNMEMCIRMNWKAYGYYWRLVPANSVTSKSTSTSNSKKIFAMTKYGMSSGIGMVHNSIQATADAYDVGAKIVRNRLRGIYSRDGRRGAIGFVEEYNPVKRILKFDSISMAAKSVRISESVMRKWVLSGKYINNTRYVVPDYNQKPNYILYKGNKKIGTYESYSAIAGVVGLHRTQVSRKIKNNQPLGMYRVVVK